jgi:hypothetical protein
MSPNAILLFFPREESIGFILTTYFLYPSYWFQGLSGIGYIKEKASFFHFPSLPIHFHCAPKSSKYFLFKSQVSPGADLD